MTTTIELKKTLRNSILNSRQQITTEVKKESDSAIAQQLFSLPVIQNAAVIFCYISTADEINTVPLINTWIAEGKSVIVPRVEKNRQMSWHYFTGWEELSLSSFQILEPTTNKNIFTPYETIDAIITPCLASDTSGYRLGYGGGYYDSFLAQKSNKAITLCRDRFLLDDIPREKHDIAIKSIITETQSIQNEL